MGSNRLLASVALILLISAQHLSANVVPARAIDGVRLIGSVDEPSAEDSYAAGKQMLAAGKTAEALAAFQRGLAATPGSVDALDAIGVCYDRLGRADLARGFYEAGLVIDPTAPRLLNNLGYSLFLSGNLDGAIPRLRAAAASGDRDVARAARATLKLVVERPAVSRPKSEAAVTPAGIGIEVTNNGEQRLVFDTVGFAGPASADRGRGVAQVTARETAATRSSR